MGVANEVLVVEGTRDNNCLQRMQVVGEIDGCGVNGNLVGC